MRQASREKVAIERLKPHLMNSADALLNESDGLGRVERRKIEPWP
jgi:hypothetical protein